MENLSRITLAIAGLILAGFALWWFMARDPFAEAEAMFERGDYVSAYRDYLELANDGDPRAQFAVARILEQGLSQNIYDTEQALIWLRRSAQGGYAFAQLYLGDLFADGTWIAFDPVQAEEWWGRAADQNLHEAWPRIYSLYPIEPEIEPSPDARQPRQSDFTRLQGLSDRGQAWAAVLLARFIEADYLGDEVMALELYQRATDAGSAEARYHLAELIFENQALGGTGEAQALLLEAAEVGHGPAAAALADSIAESDPQGALFWSYVTRKSEDPRAIIDAELLSARAARVGDEEADRIRREANDWRPTGRPEFVRGGGRLVR